MAVPRSRPLVGCTQLVLSRFHPGRGGATVLKVGVKNFGPPTFAYLGTRNNIVQFFIIVIMMSKRIPATNDIIHNSGLSDYCGETETVGQFLIKCTGNELC